ncbi:hypothetical protein S245_016150, partial [Arachis hypogaea]
QRERLHQGISPLPFPFLLLLLRSPIPTIFFFWCRNEREREVGETEAASWEGKGKDGQKTLLTSLKTSRIIIDLGHGHYSLATSANRYYYMCLNDLLAGVGNAGVGVLDAICMESKWKLYLGNSTIMYPGDLIEMIVFIVHGKLEIKDSSGTSGHISDGDACCQGLLFWYLQRALSNSNTDGDKLFFPEERFLSTKSITCLTDVEVFVVEVTDLEKILTRFTKFLHTPRIEEAIKRHKMLERLHEESGSHFD